MPKSGIITEVKRINNSDNAYCVDFPTYGISRVFFTTSEGISRHINMQNLYDCLEGRKRFDRDAFFFRKERAVSEANIILNSGPLPEHYRSQLEQLQAIWVPQPYIPNNHNTFIPRIDRDFGEPAEICKPTVRKSPKRGRNILCICNSGLKTKHCCKEY